MHTWSWSVVVVIVALFCQVKSADISREISGYVSVTYLAHVTVKSHTVGAAAQKAKHPNESSVHNITITRAWKHTERVAQNVGRLSLATRS